jgi:hypothetical protein
LYVTDALEIDSYHVASQLGRSSRHRVFAFNGSAGVWRKQAIADAGGFTWETVTEDMLLSFRAYMKGYNLVYAPHHPQCLEVTSNILSHVQQRHRWTKGAVQVYRNFASTMLLSRNVPFMVKYEFVAKTLASSQMFCHTAVHILYPHVQLNSFLVQMYQSMTVAVTAAYLITTFHVIFAKVSGKNGHYKNLWSRITRIRFIVCSYALQRGMALFQFQAMLEGALSDDATFLTTPKAGAPNQSHLKGDFYVAAFAGLLVACHHILFYFVYTPPMGDDIVLQVLHYFWVPISVAGLVWVSASFLAAKSKDLLQKLWKNALL